MAGAAAGAGFGDHAYLRGLDLVDVVLAGGTALVSHGYGLGGCWGDGDLTPPQLGLLPLPHVQLRETENSWRLDRSHRGGDCRDIPCLVDASAVRTLNTASRGSMKLRCDDSYGAMPAIDLLSGTAIRSLDSPE